MAKQPPALRFPVMIIIGGNHSGLAIVQLGHVIAIDGATVWRPLRHYAYLLPRSGKTILGRRTEFAPRLSAEAA